MPIRSSFKVVFVGLVLIASMAWGQGNDSFLFLDWVNAVDGEYAPGAPIGISYKVDNYGSEASAPYRAYFYASTSSHTYESGTPLGFADHPALGVDGSITNADTGQFPSPMANGAYYISVVISNSLDSQPNDGKKWYDTTTVTVNGNANAPDLSVVAVTNTSGGTNLAGGALTVQYTIANVGSGLSSGFTVDFYASADTAITSADWPLLPSASKSGLPAGATSNYTATVSLPVSIPPGHYYVGIIITGSNDGNAGNNWGYDATRRITVPEPWVSFGGVVTVQGTGQVIPGAVVQWGRYTAKTDGAGNYGFTNLAGGTNILKATRSGFMPTNQIYAPAPFAYRTQNIQMKYLGPPVVTNVFATNRAAAVSGQNSKLVDIWYDLDSWAITCTVSVLVSTNRGVTYDLPAFRFSGDGVGSSVVPGMKKLIAWDAGADWNNNASIDMRVKIIANDGFEADEEASNIFSLDTGNGPRPVVKFVNSPFTSDKQSTCFLQGVGLEPMITGGLLLPLPVPFDTLIDWNQQPPGHVQFYTTVSGKQWDAPLMAGNRSVLILFISALAKGDRLRVRAVSANGVSSLPQDANLEVIEPPPLLQPFLYAKPVIVGIDGSIEDTDEGPAGTLSIQLSELLAGGQAAIVYETPAFPQDLFKGKEEKVDKGMPFFGGEKMAVQPSLDIEAKVSGDGTGLVALKGEQSYSLKKNNTQRRLPNGRFGKAATYALTPTVELLIELGYLSEQALWTADGFVGVGLNFAYSSAPIYFFASPPVYFRLDFAADVGVDMKIFSLNQEVFEPEFIMPMAFDVTGVLGCGASGILGVEGYLGGGPRFEFNAPPIPPVCQEFGIELNGGVRVMVLFFNLDLGLLHHEWWLIKDGQPVVTKMGRLEDPRLQARLKMAFNGKANESFQLISRNYAAQPEAYAVFCANNDGAAMLSNPGPRGLVTGGVFQAKVYPYSEPALSSAGTNTILLWVWDNTNRTAINRTQMQWSRRTAGVWSNPTSVWDEGTADFAPRVAVFSNGTALAAWQNQRVVLTNGAGLNDALRNMEIAVGRFNGTTWACSNLTQNAYLDHSPQLSVATNGTALIAWTASTNSDYVGSLSNRNTFAFRKWSGSTWDAQGVIASNVGMTLWTALAYDGTQGVFLAAVDPNDDQTTPDDQEIYGARYTNNAWGAWTRLTTNSIQDTRPQAVFDAAGSLLIAWAQGSNLVTCANLALSGATVVSSAGGSSGAKDFRLITGPAGQTTLLWEDVPEGGGGPNPLVVNYDTALQRWSQPVALATNSLLERSFSGAYSPTGSLLLAYNQVDTPLDTNNVPVWSNQTVDLCFMEYILDADPAVIADDVVLSLRPMPGQTTDISVVVRNLGELGVTNLAVAFYDGHPQTNGYMIADPLVISNALAGGDSVTVTQRWVVPATASPTMFYVIVDPYLTLPDRNRGNNIASGRLLDADITVPEAWALETGSSQRVVKASVFNNGAFAITNLFSVKFHRGATNGPVLATVSVGYLGAGATYEAAFVWNMAGGTFTSAFETVYVVADTANTVYEEYEDNNVRLVKVMTPLDSDLDGIPDGQELRMGSNPDASDSDGDGLPDSVETTQIGTDPAKADTDGDGFKDGNEIGAGTDPLDKNDLFAITDFSRLGFTNRLTWMVKSGKVYSVYAATNLLSGWTNPPNGILPYQQTAVSNGLLNFYHSLSSSNKGNWFYLIRTP